MLTFLWVIKVTLRSHASEKIRHSFVLPDYYLTLFRQQDETRSIKTKVIKGSISDMAFIQIKHDSLYKTSYTNKKGKRVLGMPRSLVLDYKLSRGKKVKLKCEIISIR